MIEALVLGVIQGIFEWLPISSDGALVLAQVVLFDSPLSLQDLLRVALFLHLGTFMAALIYFWGDVRRLLFAAANWKSTPNETRAIFKFLFIATIVSGALGYVLYIAIGAVGGKILLTGSLITLLVGILLLITGIVQLRARGSGLRPARELSVPEAILLGIAQGVAVLPGLSRSGLTVAALLLRKINEEDSLRISFLLSLPIVLAGNIALNVSYFTLRPELILGLLSSFFVGLLTIHVLLKTAKKLNFGWFVIGFGVLTILAAFI